MGGDGDMMMTVLLAVGGVLSLSGIVILVSDAGLDGSRTWQVLGREVQSTLVGVTNFISGAVMMAASVLITAGSSGMLSGESAVAAAGDYWPETEPNDQWRHAQPIPDGERLVGTAEPGDRDRFVVLADPDGPDMSWVFRALARSDACRLSFRRPGSPVRDLAVVASEAEPAAGRLLPGPGRELFFGVEGRGAGVCRYLLVVAPVPPD